MDSNEILEIFKKTAALLEGHFLLTSGRHSPHYFQCARVLQFPNYAELLCSHLAAQFRGKKIDVVAAPAIGGIVVGMEVARFLGARSVFSEREDGAMVFRRGFDIQPDENVVVVEDVVTTGGSIAEVVELVKQHDGHPAGVAALVDRREIAGDFDGLSLTSLVRVPAKTYEPNTCPLCEQGVKLVKPGSRKRFL